jgi:hypothetical protein
LGLFLAALFLVVVDESVEQMDKEEEEDESDMALSLVGRGLSAMGAGGGVKCPTGETCELCLDEATELEEDIIEFDSAESDESELNQGWVVPLKSN